MVTKIEKLHSFSLLDFISKKKDVNEQNADQIVEALLTPFNFKYKEIRTVSKWFHELPAYQREILLDYDNLYFELDLDDGSKYQFSHQNEGSKTLKNSERINELIKLNVPIGIARWVVESFNFPRIKLPSNAYLYVDEDEFFDLIKKSVKEYPHIIDEFKLLKMRMKDGVNIVPDNGYFLRSNSIGTTISKTRAISIYRDVFNASSLETILHELGHLERSNLYQKFDRYFYPLVQYIDEAEQFGKSFYMDSFAREGYPTAPLIQVIKQRIKKEYPTFSPMTVERLTAFRSKHLFSALVLMDTKSRNKTLLHFVKKGYITPKQSQKLLEEFFDIYDYYPKRYPFFNSAHYQKELVKNIFFKRFQAPDLLTEVFKPEMIKKAVLSDAFLDELNQKCAFIDTEKDNISLLSINNLVLGEDKVHLCLTEFPLSQREEIVSFYENYGVNFMADKLNPAIYTVEEEEMVDNVYRLLLNDFYRAPIKNPQPYVKVDYSTVGDVDLLKEYLKELKKDKRNKMQNDPAFFEKKTGLVVPEKLLKKTPFSHLCLKAKTYYGCVLNEVKSQRYKTEIYERFKARNLPLKTILNASNEEKKSLCLFQKNVNQGMIDSYLAIQKEALKVEVNVDSFIGISTVRFHQNEEEQFLPSRPNKNKNSLTR
ncbi:MAG: hypothetical protein IJY92_01890 [Alphaproteobacteria bacterium]|nr:hypothetical protein [Alphaproteobacteria bacterium]